MEKPDIVAKRVADNTWSINDQKQTYTCASFQELASHIYEFVNTTFEEDCMCGWKYIWNPEYATAEEKWQTLDRIEVTLEHSHGGENLFD